MRIMGREMNRTERDELRKLAENATPGPWRYYDEWYSAKCTIGDRSRFDQWIATFQPEFNGEANGRFLQAAGPDRILSILNTIDELEKKVSIAREALLWSEDMFMARDEMNSKVHCAPVRFSPITERVIAARKALEE